MKKSLFFIVALFVCGLTAIQAQPDVFSEEALKSLVGLWEGSYSAGQGETGLTLSVYEVGGSFKAIFYFYNLPGQSNAADGKYYMNVSYNTSDGKFFLRGYEWILRPNNYTFADLEGTLAGDVFSGYLSGSSYNFRVVKVDPDKREAEIAERGAAIAKAAANPIIAQGNTFADKIAWLQAFAKSISNYVVELNNNEMIDPQTFEYSGKDNIVITIKGLKANRTVTSKNVVFTVGSGVTLVLDNNVTVIGQVSVKSGGTLIMNNGSTITGSQRGGVSVSGQFIMNGGKILGNTTYGSGGGGVFVGGKFTMNGGTISGNSNTEKTVYHSCAGGVYVRGTFEMNGGTISDNTTYLSHGGVFVDGTFIMNGGTISGNRGTFHSNSGSGVFVDGTFIMNGGNISGNNNGVVVSESAMGLVSRSGGTFTMSGGTISGNAAGGVRTGGIFNMKDGIISGNTAEKNGGGVSVSGKFTMDGGTISGNTAELYGGGVIVGGTFTMNGGTISGNAAKTNSGGGVMVNKSGTFTMNNGIISGNTANENGGGVSVSNTFTKTGGIITGYTSDRTKGNTVSEGSGTKKTYKSYRGHAVYAASDPSRVKIKEATAGPEDNLSYSDGTSDGAWDN
jgi:hypothetical protein